MKMRWKAGEITAKLINKRGEKYSACRRFDETKHLSPGTDLPPRTIWRRLNRIGTGQGFAALMT